MRPFARTNGLRRAGAAVALVLLLAAAQPAHAAGPGVHGRVFALDESGRITDVIPGASVEFKSHAGASPLSVTAAAGGYYRANLPPGRYYFKVTAPGYKDEDAGRGFALQLSDGYAVYNFSLTRGENDPDQQPPELPALELGNLKGRVMERTAEGKLLALPKAEITLRRRGARRLERVIAHRADKTGQASGRYQVSLAAGTWNASVAHPGFEILVDREPILIQSGQGATRDFILSRLEPETPSDQGIQGIIRLQGKPAGAEATARVNVRIIPLFRSAERPEPLAPGAEGAFRRELAAGRYQVVATAEGYRPAKSGPRDVFPGRYTLVNLTLVAQPDRQAPPKKPVLDLLVFGEQPNGAGRQPLPNAGVLVRNSGQPSLKPLRAKTDTQGRIQVELAEAGDYTVLAQKFDYKPAGIRVKVSAEDDNRATITLVKNERQQPVRRPEVFPEEPRERPNPGRLHPEFDPRVEPGPPPRRQPEPNRIDPRLPVTGYVVYRNPASRTGFSGIPGARLFWQPIGRMASGRETASGRIGSYGLELAEGTYRVAVKPPAGYLPASENVVVRRGMKPRYFILTPLQRPERVRPADQGVRPNNQHVRPVDNRITVRGYVVTRSDKRRGGHLPLANVVSVWARGGRTPNNVRSNSLGEFSLSLEAGTYVVYVKSPRGFTPKQEEVHVRQGMQPVYLVLDRTSSPVPQTQIPRVPIPEALLPRRQTPGSTRLPGAHVVKQVALNLQVFERTTTQARRALAGADVTVEKGGRRVASARTDGKGFASFKLPPGAYRVAVNHRGHRAASEQVTLASAVTSRAVYLVKNGGAGTATIDPRRTPQQPPAISPSHRLQIPSMRATRQTIPMLSAPLH